MAKREIRYNDEEYDVTITIRTASLRDGIRRSVLLNEAQKTMSEEWGTPPPVVKQGSKEAEEAKDTPPPPSPDAETFERMVRQMYVIHTFPACASVSDVRNHKGAKKRVPQVITIETFLDLPEQLIELWEEATYEVNPSWVPQFMKRMEAEQEGEQGESKEASGSES